MVTKTADVDGALVPNATWTRRPDVPHRGRREEEDWAAACGCVLHSCLLNRERPGPGASTASETSKGIRALCSPTVSAGRCNFRYDPPMNLTEQLDRGGRPSPSHLSRRWLVASFIAAIWLVVYSWRVTVGHASLGTNAFDLSVFDFAIDSLSKGDRGLVSFQGQSIFSQHFMPILGLFVPLHKIFPTPLLLLYCQLIVVAGSALLLVEFQRRLDINATSSILLAAIFLFARRTHGAVAGSFYPESLQCILTLGMVLSWARGGWRCWLCVLLLLMTKEDAAIYVAFFALASIFVDKRRRTQAVQALSVAVLWAVVSLGIAIPWSRVSDGLPATNPIVEQRFGTPAGTIDYSVLARRLFSSSTIHRALNLVGTTGGLALMGFEGLLPALPGLSANLVADPQGQQAALEGHYAWAILPWLFMASAIGVARIGKHSERAGLVWLSIVLAISIADNPALQRLTRTTRDPAGATVRSQLEGISHGVVIAQPNIIPHLGYGARIYALSLEEIAPGPPDVVLLTTVGDLWPFTKVEIFDKINAYQHNSRFTQIRFGPLYAFVPIGDRQQPIAQTK